MKLSFISSTLVVASVAQAFTANVTFDQAFDNPNGSLDTVACSNGPNGLETQGFTTFGQLPGFPFIGGGPNITGFDSVECGTCWSLTFAGTGKTINVLAIDVASSFNIALEAMNALTNNQAEFLGRVLVSATQAPAGSCNS